MCPRRFTNKGAVALHEQTHTDEKPCACSICPRRISRKGHVALHERTHTGKKLYACSICPRRFAEKGKVAPHERTHTGEKPYACSMCPRFNQKSNVAKHACTSGPTRGRSPTLAPCALRRRFSKAVHQQP